MLGKKVLLNTKKTKKYLEGLPTMHLVGCWASYGVRSYAFSGKFEVIKGVSIPLVYVYDDHNGTADQWELRKITSATSGIPIIWTQSKSIAYKITELYQNDLED